MSEKSEIPPETIKAAIRKEALAVGFDAVGFASAAPDPGDRMNLDAYIKAGLHGNMAWMADTAARRSDPQTLWPEARAVVVLGLNYGPGEDPLAGGNHPDRGVVSVYAKGKDYHDIVKKRLKRLARWMAEEWECGVKVFVDTAPVMEKPLAMRAGIGWQGKHTNLVSREFGSWLFLGEVFTTLDLPPDPPAEDLCGSCTRCIDACPTAALTGPHRIDPRACVSYLTIEHKEELPERYREAMGNRVYGCDDCLAVCPWNKFAVPTDEPALQPRAETTAPRLSDLSALDDETFRSVFAGSPLKRPGRDRITRNVLIAAGNSHDTRLAPVARRLLDDESPVVRDAARWALAKILGGS
ncbi:MAG: tRNA epoxyqueuosine(34) reductase QueG [Rhodospirillales bacterium]|nr:tRNA epoxyqueuosine(34) reductase QueG [Rhodospirillales bacterium]MCW8861432.1 tRNA epoxyqueuosine(34) reductase QueG [Rhodospirillales bacterium]MCW8951720.1 tRNA epoxyqueuosine(34) reductase QueG [Rhodospirillales bacterium]MCW8971407.1 tRNA epoxyqueuosine(34) reductase QueG [Rhodospirillales bacterium]MCW9002638.1 tRNA epoxyqueuosine(34) reductase QueG [Rhodospirillales bacterium]